MPGGVAENPEGVVLVGVGHPGGAEPDDCAFRVVDGVIGDLDVEVKLLRPASVGERRRLVVRRELEGQPPSRRVGQRRPGVVVLPYVAAQNRLVEHRKLVRLLAVDDGRAKLSDHGVRIAVNGSAQTARLSHARSTRRADAPTKQLAIDVNDLDGVDLRLRVGLNSGEVIAGEIGPGAGGYTAIGEQVGMAQRMESAAPPGGVMLSEPTARLVADVVVLGDEESVDIKGADHPVPARRLLGVAEHRAAARRDTTLVGRQWELAALTGVLDRSITGSGAVVGLVAPAGVGKSRLVAEVAAIAASRGIAVYSSFCESHASDIPFHAVSRLLRGTFGVDEVSDEVAREQLRERVPDADAEDLLLLDDLLGVRDPAVLSPDIAPDARRRRLTALVNGASLARSTPAVYVIEDVHWIDEVSESLLVDFLKVIPRTSSLVLMTYRPDYRGPLSTTPGSQTIALAPLNDSETGALIIEMLGPDPSLAPLTTQITDRAAGNPFFAQEIVRDLADRGVLRGDRGAYRADGVGTEATVPATLQAAIAARIDRLDTVAKATLNAASVIGSQFDAELPATLVGETALPQLIAAELVDQIKFTPKVEYVFRHPLIRTVAYESQLKADRAALHKKLAAEIERRDPDSADANAALIGEHLVWDHLRCESRRRPRGQDQGP